MSSDITTVSEHQRFIPMWRRSGTWMVVIMFVFAFSMIGLMFLYWELHTRPFRPLQEAIGSRYPNSMPRVIGGKHKSHQRDSQATLRMVISVPFDPTDGLPRPADIKLDEADRVTLTDEMTVIPQVDQVFASLLHLAKSTTDLTGYEVIEIFLEHRRPEKSARVLSSKRPSATWFQKYPRDLWTPPEPTAASPTK